MNFELWPLKEAWGLWSYGPQSHLFVLILIQLSICQLDKIWLGYEAIKLSDLYMVIDVYYCIYLYIPSGWSFLFFLILLHLSICQLDKNWPRYEVIKVCDLYLAYWHLFASIYIYTPSEWEFFFLILMHWSACHLDEN